MTKRKTKPQIRVGDCAVMRAGQMMSYARRDPGKVVAKEGGMLHVKFYGETRTHVFNQDIFKTAPCPTWLAGSRRRRRKRS